MRKILLLLWICLYPLSMSINANGPNPPMNLDVIKLRNKKIKPHEDLADVYCYVDKGCLNIIFEVSEGMSSVQLYDNDVLFYNDVHLTTNRILIPVFGIMNPIDVVIRTSQGNEYLGEVFPN